MAKSYHHMTLDQRCQIQTLQSKGKSQNSIAQELGLSKSTIIAYQLTPQKTFNLSYF
jgi:IS30 family transposase